MAYSLEIMSIFQNYKPDRRYHYLDVYKNHHEKEQKTYYFQTAFKKKKILGKLGGKIQHML